MKYLTGDPILLDDIKLSDILKYPIWITTFNEYGIHDTEVYQRPIISTNNVTPEIDIPFIALRIKGTDYCVLAEYYTPRDCLSKISVWFDGTWGMLEDIPGLKTPVFLEAIPLIEGIEGVKFVVDSEFMLAHRVSA